MNERVCDGVVIVLLLSGVWYLCRCSDGAG